MKWGELKRTNQQEVKHLRDEDAGHAWGACDAQKVGVRQGEASSMARFPKFEEYGGLKRGPG